MDGLMKLLIGFGGTKRLGGYEFVEYFKYGYRCLLAETA